MVSPIAVPMVLHAPPTEPPASVIFRAGAASATPAPSAETAMTKVHDFRMVMSPIPC
jgi:hypothetical protein